MHIHIYFLFTCTHTHTYSHTHAHTLQVIACLILVYVQSGYDLGVYMTTLHTNFVVSSVV
jgi:hypothetical protein